MLLLQGDGVPLELESLPSALRHVMEAPVILRGESQLVRPDLFSGPSTLAATSVSSALLVPDHE